MPVTEKMEPYIRNITVSNELNDVKIALEKAEFAIQDVVEGYFAFDDPDGHEFNLLWEYKRGSAKANIAADYLYVIQQKIAELEEYMQKAEARPNCKKGGAVMALASVFAAGRIDGVRQERARRKSRAVEFTR